MTNRIPWSRLLFEGVVVVISILVAFAIDAWWEKRKVEVLEQEYLARLEVAFEENAQLAKVAIERGMNDSLKLEQFIHMTPEEAEKIPSDQNFSYLRSLWRPNLHSELNTSALTAILDRDQLSADSDPELLTAIVEWRAATKKIADQDIKLDALDQEVTQALAYYPEIQNIFSLADKNNSSIEISGPLIRKIREDKEIVSRAARKDQTSHILHNSLLPTVQRKSERVLELIRETLAD